MVLSVVTALSRLAWILSPQAALPLGLTQGLVLCKLEECDSIGDAGLI